MLSRVPAGKHEVVPAPRPPNEPEEASFLNHDHLSSIREIIGSDKLAPLLLSFESEARLLLDTLDAAFKNGDEPMARRAIHALKGMAGTSARANSKQHWNHCGPHRRVQKITSRPWQSGTSSDHDYRRIRRLLRNELDD
jgi:hypothetical protein